MYVEQGCAELHARDIYIPHAAPHTLVLHARIPPTLPLLLPLRKCNGVRVCRRSIVALDELGRGTATMDGVAIAAAVLGDVTSRLGCRGVFATHYHVLADDVAADKRVAVKHMACRVEAAVGSCVPKVFCLPRC